MRFALMIQMPRPCRQRDASDGSEDPQYWDKFAKLATDPDYEDRIARGPLVVRLCFCRVERA